MALCRFGFSFVPIIFRHLFIVASGLALILPSRPKVCVLSGVSPSSDVPLSFPKLQEKIYFTKVFRNIPPSLSLPQTFIGFCSSHPFELCTYLSLLLQNGVLYFPRTFPETVITAGSAFPSFDDCPHCVPIY
jgi:hypothetical protein